MFRLPRTMRTPGPFSVQGTGGGGGPVTYDTDAQTYFDAIVTAGSTISTPQKSALNTAILSLKSNSLWTKLDFIAPLMGDDLTAARVPLKQPAGLAAMTSTGFVNGDYSASVGLISTGTQYLASNFICATGGVQTSTDCHLAVYLANTTNTLYSDTQMAIGAASSHRIRPIAATGGHTAWLSNATIVGSSSTARPIPIWGLLQSCRTGNELASYGNGQSYRTTTSATTATTANKLALFAESTTGTNASKFTMCWASSGQNFTSGEAATYNTIINTLMVALGRRVSSVTPAATTYYLLAMGGQSKSIGDSATAASMHWPGRHPTALTSQIGAKAGATTVTGFDRFYEFNYGRASIDIGNQLPLGEVLWTMYSEDPTKRFIVISNGNIAKKLNVLDKGGTSGRYEETIARASEMVGLVEAAGGNVVPVAYFWWQGTSDEDASNTSYATDLSQLQIDFQTDINAICGTSETVPLMFVQTCDFTASVPRSTAWAGLKQSDAAVANANVWEILPEYLLTPVADGVHMNADSTNNIVGGHLAKAVKAKLASSTSKGLKPISVSRSGADITIVFNKGGLLFDTAVVSDPSGSYASRKYATAPGSATDTTVVNKLGFEFCDDDGSAPSVSISGFNGAGLTVASINAAFTTTNITGDTLTVNLSGTPTGTNKRIRNAFTGTSGAATGPTTGARSCLRDADASITPATGGSVHNYCLTFDEAAT